MQMRMRFALAALLSVALYAGLATAAGLDESMKKGTPDLKSAGPLAFGPSGILLIGDTQGGAIFAVATGDTAPAGTGALKIDKIDEKIAGMLGSTPKDVLINDLAINPMSGNAYVSVARGKGPSAAFAILKINRKGEIKEVALKDVAFSKAVLTNASEKSRQEAITQIAYVKDRVIVAGLSNEEFASTLRAIPFPFQSVDKGAGIKIFHGAHGRLETASPIRTFAPFDIKGETHILAAYTCTPLVKIPVSELKAGAKVMGTTVAELGNRNKPLDMIVYQKNGKNYILLANNSRGMMKITTDNIDTVTPITEPVKGGGTAGLKYETIANLKGVEQMAQLDKDNALILVRGEGGSLSLDTIPLP